MSSGYVVPVDPSELNRFSHENLSLDDIDDESLIQDMMSDLLKQTQGLDTILPLLDKIPPMEADIIELYFLNDKRQADIASIFGMTQAAVSYRLGRGILRIKFLLELPELTPEQMASDLSEVFPMDTPLPIEFGGDLQITGSVSSGDVTQDDANLSVDVKILILIWQTTCQTKVARMLNLTQGRVRHKFFGAVKKLKALAAKDEKWKLYADLFGKISLKKFNILSEVKLPQWSGRGGNQLL